jgi:transposase
MHQSNLQAVDYHQFENSKEGCIALLKRIKSLAKESGENRLFCGEHTGLYRVCSSEFLIKKDLYLRLENPLQIK